MNLDQEELEKRVIELEQHIAKQNELIQRQMIQLAEMQIKEARKK